MYGFHRQGIFYIVLSFSVVFIGVLPPLACAMQKEPQVDSGTYILCGPNMSVHWPDPSRNSADGNDPDSCAQAPGFAYVPEPATSPAIAWWSGAGLLAGRYLGACDISAWLPYGDLSTDSRTRYDFWNANGTAWYAWPGRDIDQYAAPDGWYELASHLAINSRGGIEVTARDDGGHGNLAFAAMKFTCTFSPA